MSSRSSRSSFDNGEFVSKPLARGSTKRRSFGDSRELAASSSVPISRVNSRRNLVYIDAAPSPALPMQDDGQGKTMSCSNITLENLDSTSDITRCFNDKEQKILRKIRVAKAGRVGPAIQAIQRQKARTSVFNFDSMTMISDNIVLGGRDDANQLGRLQEYGISHVLNVAQQLPMYFPSEFVYLKVPVVDSPNFDLSEFMPRIVAFIHHVVSINGRVLVHCISGVSRSVTVLFMYFIIQHKMTLRTIFQFVKARRSQIGPNDGFKLQLAQLEIKELGFSTVADHIDPCWDFYHWNMIKKTVPTRQGFDLDAPEDSDTAPVCCVIS